MCGCENAWNVYCHAISARFTRARCTKRGNVMPRIVDASEDKCGVSVIQTLRQSENFRLVTANHHSPNKL